MESTPGMDSHSAVARAAKLAHSHVGRILRAESAINLDTLDDVAAAFGVSAWELLTDSEATRKLALERMMFGPHAPDSRIEESFGPSPHKVVSIRQRKPK